jgi:threonine aldolase
MRQSGFMAAAGIVALHEMIERLSDDHDHACLLAEGLAQIPGIVVDMDIVKTNMVFFSLHDDVPYTADDVAERLHQAANIWVGGRGPRHFRAVTHYWIGEPEVTLFLDTLRDMMAEAV